MREIARKKTAREVSEWETASLAEAARYLGVSRQWLHVLINRGELKPHLGAGFKSRFTGKRMPRLLREDVERLKRARDRA
jgi:site-specific recombinase XerC